MLNTETIYISPDSSKTMIDSRTQCAMYAMEMVSYALGMHHVITVLIIGKYMSHLSTSVIDVAL
jgi:hypothetical protein